jgi:hypothetical protein
VKVTIIVAPVVALGVTGGAGAAFVVTSKNIKNGTIQLVDISRGAKAGLRVRRGPPGPPGISSITEVVERGTIAPGSAGTVVATCPTDLAPISGGYLATNLFGGDRGISVNVNRRSQQRGWEVHGVNSSGDSMLLYVHVYCAPGIRA